MAAIKDMVKYAKLVALAYVSGVKQFRANNTLYDYVDEHKLHPHGALSTECGVAVALVDEARSSTELPVAKLGLEKCLESAESFNTEEKESVLRLWFKKCYAAEGGKISAGDYVTMLEFADKLGIIDKQRIREIEHAVTLELELKI